MSNDDYRDRDRDLDLSVEINPEMYLGKDKKHGKTSDYDDYYIYKAEEKTEDREPKKTADQARNSLPYSEYYVIEGATHSFNGVYGDQVVDISSEVLKKWDEEGR